MVKRRIHHTFEVKTRATDEIKWKEPLTGSEAPVYERNPEQTVIGTLTQEPTQRFEEITEAQPLSDLDDFICSEEDEFSPIY